MKRNLTQLLGSVSQNTRSKKPKLWKPFSTKDNKYWVSATRTYNYMLNDTFTDWNNVKNNRLKLYNTPFLNVNRKDNSTKDKDFKSFLMNKGNEFEKKIINKISSNYPVVKISDYIDEESFKKSCKYILDGYPILHSVPIINKKNNTKGIIDLLIRNDYLEKIINDEELCNSLKNNEIVKTKIKNNHYYYVIDIKFSTINLSSNKNYILNNKNIPAYKSQLYIYNKAISNIQGYLNPTSFILARKYKYNGRHYSSFETLGPVNFLKHDKKFADKSKKAISWIRTVYEYGLNWSINPIFDSKLFPNMKVDSGYKTNKDKKIVSDEIGEITQIWNCTIKNREKALKNGVNSWLDPRCNSSILGVKGNRGKIIDQIININRQDKDKVLPLKINNNFKNWKEKENEVFVDFETISSLFLSDIKTDFKKSEFIFLIGIYFFDKEDNNWKYKNFCANNISIEEEKNVINNFKSFINLLNNPKIYYWHAEQNFWNKKVENDNFNWIDLLKIVKNEPVVIKGCFDFKLKNFSKALYDHGLINYNLESNCNSGMNAQLEAFKCYKNNNIDNIIFKDIINYNNFDCRILFEIINYLRNNHT